MAISDQQRARQSADAMWKNDDACRHIGLLIENVSPGQAVVSMKIEKHHTNGHDICHGGFIFTLADSAFAYACNSYNQITVAQQAAITFVAPGRLGDTLKATAQEMSKAGRSGTYDIAVRNQNDEMIALFRGLSRTVKGQLFEEES